MRRIIHRLLEAITVYSAPGFRITLFDLLRRTPRLRDDVSPFNMWREWRAAQGEGLRKGIWGGHLQNVAPWIRQDYYGKADRIALATEVLVSVLHKRIPGDVIELGVYRGDTAQAFADVLVHPVWQDPEHRLFLCDSFEGMPVPTGKDRGEWTQGDLAAPYVEVQRRFAGYTFVRLVKGFFSDTLAGQESARYSFAHIDCDLYESTRQAIAHVLPRLTEGGAIVFDDYGFNECTGAMEAIVEQCPSAVYLPTGQALYWHTT